MCYTHLQRGFLTCSHLQTKELRYGIADLYEAGMERKKISRQ